MHTMSHFCLKPREAWSKLGDISKEEAMESYVYELKEVQRHHGFPESTCTMMYMCHMPLNSDADPIIPKHNF